MKKLLSICIFMMLSFVASCADYEEGKHYTVVSDQVTAAPEVREFFSFYCPHCFSFEPFMQNVKKSLPSGVRFERNHVDFLRTTTPEIQFMLTKSLVIAEQLKVEKKIVDALFKHIHVQRSGFTSKQDIKNVLVANGVDGQQFDKLFGSFAIVSQAKYMKKRQDELANSKMLTGVPAVFVNGKYRINAHELDKKDTAADYKKLVKHLLSLDK
jgi:thiol:disulfide interchange protein DsbA